MRAPSTIYRSAGMRGRIAALTPRERGFLVAGALALFAFAVYFFWDSEKPDPVERPLTLTEPAATVPPSAPPAPVPPVAIAAPLPPQASPGAASGVSLRGVMGGGNSGGAAIFSMPDGSQRVVRVGRELVPGLTLRRVGVRHAIGWSGSGEMRFELNAIGGTMLPAGAPAAGDFARGQVATVSGPVPGRDK